MKWYQHLIDLFWIGVLCQTTQQLPTAHGWEFAGWVAASSIAFMFVRRFARHQGFADGIAAREQA